MASRYRYSSRQDSHIEPGLSSTLFYYESLAVVESYQARTSHGSNLSRVVHAWVLSRSNRRESWDLFRAALESDVGDLQCGTTPEGIHSR